MSAEPIKTKKLSRRAKLFIGLASAVVLYTVTGFFIVPAVIKSQMEKRLPVLLGRPVTVAQVKVNPYALCLTIRGLAINQKDGAAFAGFDEFYAELKYSSFFKRGWAVQELYLTHPFAGIIHDKEGKLNVDDIIAKVTAGASTNTAPAGKTAIPLVMIDSLHIDNANVTLEDDEPAIPVKTKLIPIRLHLENLSTDPKARNPYSFSAASDTGETFNWNGSFSLEPLEVTGDIAIKGLDLKKYSPYLARFCFASISDGRVDVGSHYTASLGTNGPDVTLANADVLVNSLVIKSASPEETIFAVSNVLINIADASLSQRRAHITQVKTFDGSALARRNADGVINLIALLKTNAVAAPAAASNSVAAPFAVTVDNIDVERYNITVEDLDLVPAKPAKFTFNNLAFTATNFSTVSNPAVGVNIVLALNNAGRVAVKGTIHAQPPSADLALDISSMDLRPLQPYIEQQQLKISLGSGIFNMEGHATYDPKGSPQAAFDGSLSVTNFATSDMIEYKDFIKFGGLAINGIQAAYLPNKLAVQELNLSGLSTSINMLTNQQINLMAVLPPKPPGAPAAATSRTAGAGLDFPVSLASLSIDKASIHLTDASIEPKCDFSVQEFGGTIKGLSSDPAARAAVDIHGKVDDVSTFSVVGDVNPLSKELAVNLAIDCKNVNLTPFTPYMEKYGGYPLQRGKLLVDLHHNIANGQLAASNHIVVNGLTLGRRNGSPDATKLPVKLGVALLKDREGNIILDVPLSGNLNSPDFKVWPIVWQVVGNIFAKAATAPFTLLGSLFGGGEEMSYVDFQPGQSDFSPTEQAKLDKLAKGLFARPTVEVEISATSNPQSDVPVLARQKLNELVRSEQAKELIAAGTPPETVASIQVEPTNYPRLLKALYVQIVGTNAPTPAEVVSVNTNTMATALPLVTAVSVAAAPAISAPHSAAEFSLPIFFVKGGERMVYASTPGNLNFGLGFPFSTLAAKLPAAKVFAPKTVAEKPASTAGGATTNAAAVVETPVGAAPEPSQEQMESAILATVHVTPDDLRALMQARARSVQTALVGRNIEGQRLYILAPAPVSLNSQGQARANMALQ